LVGWADADRPETTGFSVRGAADKSSRPTKPCGSGAKRTTRAPSPVTDDLPDSDARDGCRVRWSSGRGGRLDSEVLLYVEEGAGHTWPGGWQYLPKSLIGTVCRDFDATQAIWDFFKTDPRP